VTTADRWLSESATKAWLESLGEPEAELLAGIDDEPLVPTDMVEVVADDEGRGRG
jgi:hypothetical protein